jgi:PBP1b-binding outer membrane lipoprotein LpoB
MEEGHMSYRGMCIFCAVLMLAMLLAACSQGGMEERKTDENGRRVITFTCANLSKTDEGVIKVAVKSFENMHAMRPLM